MCVLNQHQPERVHKGFNETFRKVVQTCGHTILVWTPVHVGWTPKPFVGEDGLVPCPEARSSTACKSPPASGFCRTCNGAGRVADTATDTQKAERYAQATPGREDKRAKFEPPIVATRVWCQWEIFCTITSNARFELGLSEADRLELLAQLLSDNNNVRRSVMDKPFEHLDCRNAEASKPSDLTKIHAAIAAGPGAHRLNLLVLQSLVRSMKSILGEKSWDRSVQSGVKDTTRSALSEWLELIKVALSNPVADAVCDFTGSRFGASRIGWMLALAWVLGSMNIMYWALCMAMASSLGANAGAPNAMAAAHVAVTAALVAQCEQPAPEVAQRTWAALLLLGIAPFLYEAVPGSKTKVRLYKLTMTVLNAVVVMHAWRYLANVQMAAEVKLVWLPEYAQPELYADLALLSERDWTSALSSPSLSLACVSLVLMYTTWLPEALEEKNPWVTWSGTTKQAVVAPLLLTLVLQLMFCLTDGWHIPLIGIRTSGFVGIPVSALSFVASGCYFGFKRTLEFFMHTSIVCGMYMGFSMLQLIWGLVNAVQKTPEVQKASDFVLTNAPGGGPPMGPGLGIWLVITAFQLIMNFFLRLMIMVAGAAGNVEMAESFEATLNATLNPESPWA